MAETSRHRRSHSTTGLYRVSWDLMSAHTPTNHLLPLHTPSKHHVCGSRLLTQGRIFELSHAEGSVRTWRGTSRWMTNRLSPWCPSPSNSSHKWKGGLQRSRSRSNPTKSKNHRPRSPGSMLMGPPVRGFQDRQAPYRETTPSGVQRCGRHLQDSSSLDFMVARTPSSTLFRHGLAVSAPWTIATAPGLQNGLRVQRTDKSAPTASDHTCLCN